MFERLGWDAGGGRDDGPPAGAVPDLAGLDDVRGGLALAAVLSGVHPDDVVDAYDLVELAASLASSITTRVDVLYDLVRDRERGALS